MASIVPGSSPWFSRWLRLQLSAPQLSCPLLSSWAAGLRCQLSLPLWSRSSAQPLHWGILQMHCVEEQLRVSGVLHLLQHLQEASAPEATPNPKNSLLQYLWTRAGAMHHPSARKHLCHSLTAGSGWRLAGVGSSVAPTNHQPSNQANTWTNKKPAQNMCPWLGTGNHVQQNMFQDSSNEVQQVKPVQRKGLC